MQKGFSKTGLIVIVVVVLVGIAGWFVWQNLQPAPSEQPLNGEQPSGQDIPFEIIDQGAYSGHDESQNYQITDNQAWLNLWKIVYSIEEPAPSVSSADFGIDFEKEIVLADFQGERATGGYSIQIEKIVELANEVQVHVKEISPGENCGVTEALTQPYQIVKCRKIDKLILFQKELKVERCLPL